MNKAEKAFCVLYIVYMLIYWPFFLLIPRYFEEIFPFHILLMVLGLVLIIIVMRDIYKRDFPNPNTKVTWTILIFVTGIAIFPYLFLHGFKPRPNKRQASQNKPQGDDARAVTDGVSPGMENKGKIRRAVPVIAIAAVYGGLIIACIFIGPHLLRPERNKRQLEEIAGLQPSDVVSISIVKGEQVFEVPVTAWEIISEAFLASEEVSFIGWSGEHWETFWDLDIQVRNSPVIRLKVETRPSLEGRKIVSLQRLSGSVTHYYGYYDGARLSDVLKEYCPIQ